MTKPSFLKLKNGGKLAYHKLVGARPGVIFLGGFRSDMGGVKALALEELCRARGQSFVRFDYEGHGQSTGEFDQCTIGRWKHNAVEILERLTKGPQLLVGSSMGGWLALLLARDKPRRVGGVIGIAPAPDFTERMLWERFDDRQRAELNEKGRVMVPSDMGAPYPITSEFIMEGRDHLLLQSEIRVFCPVRILQGMKDDVVPWEVSFSINEKLASHDVRTILVENGDHRLSEPADLERLTRITTRMLDQIAQEAGGE